MATKRIDQLTAAAAVNDADLFVIEQSGVAKKATGALVNGDFKTYAAKYAKSKRFIGTSATHQFVLNDKNIADIYNAQMSGNQIVYLYDTLTTITYRVNYCFIDSQGYMCILACAQHFDGDALMPIENRFSDYLYVKTRTHGATSMQLYTKSQDSGGGGGGDSSVMKVTLTYNSQTHTYSSDKTYAEVTAAYNAGKDIICDASGIIYRLDNVGYSSISFTRTTVSDNGDYNTWTHEVITVNSINSWTRTQIENDM